MSAIVFAGGKLDVIAVDTNDAGVEMSRLELPRVKSAEQLRQALAQYTAWLFQNHMKVVGPTVEVAEEVAEEVPSEETEADETAGATA